MPVYEQQVLPTIVVEVEEAAAPADVASVVAHPGGYGYVVEIPTPTVVIESLPLIGEITAKDIQLSVAIIVGRSNAHSRHRLTVVVECDATQDSFFSKLYVTLIDVEQRQRLVACYIDVHQSIIVEISR